jgi:hypothetical protein
MQLSEFFDYKNKLMEDILTNESIVKLLDDSVELSDAKCLAYKNVFPYEYIPDTIEQARTFICFDVDVQESINKTFLLPTLYIWVFSHKSDLHMREGGVLTDKLVSEIAKAINGSRFYGLGELDLYSVRRFTPVTDYQGKVMTFHAKEFNRTSPNTKPIPSNRKTG